MRCRSSVLSTSCAVASRSNRSRAALKLLSSSRANLVGTVQLQARLAKRLERLAASYFVGPEPLMRISTSLLALCCQSGVEATLDTSMSARSRSNGSR
jgi:hypothetical protein